MNRHKSMTAFYLETVLMVIIFVLVIAILSQVFGLARSLSRDAKQLTQAVCLAQNAAEAAAASGSEDELLQLLQEDGNASLQREGTDAVVTAYYDADMQPAATDEIAGAAAKETDGEAVEQPAGRGEPALRLEAAWKPEESPSGSFHICDITVYAADRSDPIYTLNTGTYVREQEENR